MWFFVLCGCSDPQKYLRQNEAALTGDATVSITLLSAVVRAKCDKKKKTSGDTSHY